MVATFHKLIKKWSASEFKCLNVPVVKLNFFSWLPKKHLECRRLLLGSSPSFNSPLSLNSLSIGNFGTFGSWNRLESFCWLWLLRNRVWQNTLRQIHINFCGRYQIPAELYRRDMFIIGTMEHLFRFLQLVSSFAWCQAPTGITNTLKNRNMCYPPGEKYVDHQPN